MTSIAEELSLEQLCGQLFVVGFDGTELPDELAAALNAGVLGGIILFRRNLIDLESTWRLCRSIHAAFPPNIPPFIGVDEEGGRVSRLPPPFVRLPPMRWFGQRDDVDATHRAATWLGQQLSQLGITWNFAPVLDVDTNPQNPIIGDRSFSSDPVVVSRHGRAFIAGLQQQGVGACGKHFPGHGDTFRDSHVELPLVAHSRERLEAVELLPFRQCAGAGLAGMMSAHVTYSELDATRMATLSPLIMSTILREQIGFSGVLFSDDLEMGAVAQAMPMAAAARGALLAGCDALLICHHGDAAEGVRGAILSEARDNEGMRTRVLQAATRLLSARRRFAARPAPTVRFEPSGFETAFGD